ncbi:TetR/AcrR family transcriptional regulator [Frateuria aurantia]
MSSDAPLNNLATVDVGIPPRSTRGEKRRQSLLQAARRLFTSQGYEATSLQQIVKEAGGSLSTAYQLFGSKAGIFRAVILEMVTHIREQALPEALLSQPPAEALPQIIEQLMLFSVDAEAVAIRRQLIAESHSMPELAAELHAWFEQHMQLPIRDYFRNWVGRSDFADTDPDVLSSLFMQMCCSWHMHHLLLGVGSRPEPEEISRLALAATELFFPAAPSAAAATQAQGAS